MKIQQLVGDDKKIEAFLDGVNQAFKTRSTTKIPYEPLTSEKLIRKINTGTNIYIAEDREGVAVGGFLAKTNSKSSGQLIMKISCVWVLPSCQGQGIANKMLEYAEVLANSQNVHALMVRVASIYEPAIRLYQKCGYRKHKVYANTPGTYYFLEMRRQLVADKCSNLRRNISYLVSIIKFRMLFKIDSTPRKLCKVIYRNENK